jgi:hypothetical protein
VVLVDETGMSILEFFLDISDASLLSF